MNFDTSKYSDLLNLQTTEMLSEDHKANTKSLQTAAKWILQIHTISHAQSKSSTPLSAWYAGKTKFLTNFGVIFLPFSSPGRNFFSLIIPLVGPIYCTHLFLLRTRCFFWNKNLCLRLLSHGELEGNPNLWLKMLPQAHGIWKKGEESDLDPCVQIGQLKKKKTIN